MNCSSDLLNDTLVSEDQQTSLKGIKKYKGRFMRITEGVCVNICDGFKGNGDKTTLKWNSLTLVDIPKISHFPAL